LEDIDKAWHDDLDRSTGSSSNGGALPVGNGPEHVMKNTSIDGLKNDTNIP